MVDTPGMGPRFRSDEPGYALGVGLVVVLVALGGAGVLTQAEGYGEWARFLVGLQGLVLGGATMAAYRWGYRSFFFRWILFVCWVRPSFGRYTPLGVGTVVAAIGLGLLFDATMRLLL